MERDRVYEGHDVGVAATRFHRAMRNQVAQALDAFDLSGADYGTLDHITRHPEPSNSDLARYLLITPQSFGKIAAGLESRGLIRRAPAEGAHRYRLALTPAGQRVLAVARPHVEEAQQRLLAPLDHDERTQFERALTLCADHHDHASKGRPRDI